ncbi:MULTISPECIES: NCS2 family permease [Helcococcus]|uniref:NCS2 family permease n=1 Tax=Helcococcus bovis TaxID=3153252 RepID=A0ABW9F4B4_9FIRM
MEKFFKLKENKTNFKTEFIAGLTTFMTMAYILFLNPDMLSKTGMDFNGVFIATAISAGVATIIMGLFAKYPFALAPGIGLSAYFTYTVCLKYGFKWQEALFIILLEGIIFILLSFFKIRETIFNSIPRDLKESISVGIGFFIALIGFNNAGIITGEGATILSLGKITQSSTLLAMLGILITAVLVAKNVKGAILLGIIITTVIGIPMGVTQIPADFTFFKIPSGLENVAFKVQIPKNILNASLMISIFTFLFVDMFDTVGTLAGVASKTNSLDENGNLPRAGKALLSDAIGTTLGSLLGTSTVTTFVESSAGVAAGGRTGLTSVITGCFFLISLFLSPLFLLVPSAATAPALIVVGIFMSTAVKKINWDDFSVAIPSFITIAAMPFTYSIAEGIVFGIISYTIVNLATGQHKKISPLLYVLTFIFILRYMFLPL